jgi:hypothetical protein
VPACGSSNMLCVLQWSIAVCGLFADCSNLLLSMARSHAGNANATVETARECGMAVVAVAGRTPVYELTAADLVVRRRAVSKLILGAIVLLALLQHSRCIPMDRQPSLWGHAELHLLLICIQVRKHPSESAHGSESGFPFDHRCAALRSCRS